MAVSQFTNGSCYQRGRSESIGCRRRPSNCDRGSKKHNAAGNRSAPGIRFREQRLSEQKCAKVVETSPARSQQTARNTSWLFAHPSSRALAVRPLPIGIAEAEQLYAPGNAVGAPPGRTTPGASTPGAAIGTRETPGSANFTFGLSVVSLPGRGYDLDFGLSYNSRIWTKSLGFPTQMTYNMDGGWIAPGFVAGYGYLDDQSDGSATQFMIRDPSGTRHRMVNVPLGSNSYESDDGTLIKLTVNGAQVTPAIATYPGGMQIRYGVGDTSVVTRYYRPKSLIAMATSSPSPMRAIRAADQRLIRSRTRSDATCASSTWATI